MLTLEPFSEDQGRSAVHREDQPISFLTPYGFTHPLTRTHRVIRLTWGRVEDFGSSRAFGRSGGDLASEFTTACQGAPGILSSDFGQRRAVTRETSFRPISSRGLGAAICDTQAGVPSARRLGAQLAFKDFDGSRDSAIHTNTASNKHRLGLAKAGCLVECSLTLFVRGLVISGSYAYNPAKLGGGERITTESVGAKSAKIPAHRE
ncbi:hypothetical protein Bca4012_102913 [Brassica carinata]